MLNLNILSPEEKKKSALIWKYSLIKRLIWVIVILSALISVILLGAKMMLNNKLQEVKKQNEMININNTKINKKIKTYNDKIRVVNLIQKDFIPWSKILYFFNNIIPEKIHINTLNFNLSQNNFSISGIADTRTDLLNFKDTINKCSILNEINFPLNTILKKEDIDFTVSINFKDDLKDMDLNNLNCE